MSAPPGGGSGGRGVGEDGARGAPRARPQPGCGLLWVTIPSRCTAGPPPTGRSARPRSSGGAEVGAAPPPPPGRPQRPPSPPPPLRPLQAPPGDASDVGAPFGPRPGPDRRRRSTQSRLQAAGPGREPGAPPLQRRPRRALPGPETSPPPPQTRNVGRAAQEVGPGARPGGQKGLRVPTGTPESGPRGAGSRFPAGGRGAGRRVVPFPRRNRKEEEQFEPLQIRQHRGRERRRRGGGAEPFGAAGRGAPGERRGFGPQTEFVPPEGQRRNGGGGREELRPAALRAPRRLCPDSRRRPPVRPRRPRAPQPPARRSAREADGCKGRGRRAVPSGVPSVSLPAPLPGAP